ncbi:fibronectin type III domain-containing protein [Enterococcus plantarum]|uniref:Fibronectin type III domain-containing protein n=1 Tax=Enterococcus plantarum TaxID=1077675 RepID=A0A2W3ZE91_9ENTE|nr:fibronectin type III domain-containing protein [Enterococcus plantarum]PZL74777.1 fibronectin type III domain-containing protein [Enterococcus plantarum]
MKKNIRLIFISFIILIIFPSDWSYAIEIQQPVAEESVTSESTEESMPSESSEIPVDDSSFSQESTTEEESIENGKITNTNDTNNLVDENNSEINSKNMLRADDPQDTDGFWLVDTAATLTEYLKDSQKLKFRLTDNIDLGSNGYQLKDGMIIDGANHIITYNKGTSATRGFYANQENAVIEIRNTQFGNSDGSGAVGYYGFLSGGSAINMTFIFDSVDYYSTNGQMIYNTNGSVIMRGQNTIDQRGTSTYSQEWAEINYVEIQNGHTSITHSSNQTRAFIWSTSTYLANPHANQSQIVVRENAQLDIQTNSNMTYGTLAPSYVVEKNAVFNLDKVTLATDSARNQFFASNQTQPVTFDFQEQSQVDFKLPLPINLYTAKGGMNIGENADVSLDVASGTIFTTSSSSNFALNMNKAKQVSFAGTSLGTLGLNGANGVNNLSFTSNYLQKIETFSSKTDSAPTQELFKQASDLSVQGTNFTNIPGSSSPFSDGELLALKNAQKLVFSEFVDVPDQLELYALKSLDTSVSLIGSSVNNGSQATEVKFFIFSSEEDANDLRKARQIVTLNSFENQKNTVLKSQYEITIDGLNPNTLYWAQMVVINQAGESEFSDAEIFATQPQLSNLTANVTTTTAIINGVLASDTGKWTDYSNGEAAAIPDQQADFGSKYRQVTVEYSKNKDFPKAETMSQVAVLSGNKNQNFSAKLKGLEGDVTYYVRVSVAGVYGEEVVLAMTPLTEFQTITDIIKVEVPIEMAFQTQNKDIGTLQEGQVSSSEYPVVNKGNTPTKVSITNLTKENAAANQLQLLDSLSGNLGQDELALQLLVDNNQAEPLFLTNELSKNPLSVGVLNVNEEKNLRLKGKYFNATRQAIFPTYKVTFKVEKDEE